MFVAFLRKVVSVPMSILCGQDRQAVRFQFEENVSTFLAGKFSVSPGVTRPALVYLTFNNKIQVSTSTIAR